jgi:hypothetical protein
MQKAWCILLLDTTFLTGLIWTIHFVHYPMFKQYKTGSFPSIMKEHQTRIGRVVMPFMLLELGLSVYLLIVNIENAVAHINFLLLLIIWGATFFHQVPAHKRLSNGKNDHTLTYLCRSNRIRTALWTVRMLILFFYLFPLSHQIGDGVSMFLSSQDHPHIG